MTVAVGGRLEWGGFGGGVEAGAVIDEFLFFEEQADALEPLDFVGGVEKDAIGLDLEAGQAAFAQFAAYLVFIGTIDFLDVEDDFVEFERIVVNFAELNLPGADVRNVIKDMIKFIEIDECALDFIEVHFPDFGAARDIADEARDRAVAVRARLVGQAAVNVVAGAIAQDNGATGVEWGENQFAGTTGRERRAGLRIDDFHDAEIRIKMITAGGLSMRGTFSPGLLGLSKPIGGEDMNIRSAQRLGEVPEFLAEAVADLFTGEHKALELLATNAFRDGLVHEVINEGRDANDDIGRKIADEANVAIGPHYFAAAGTESHIA